MSYLRLLIRLNKYILLNTIKKKNHSFVKRILANFLTLGIVMCKWSATIKKHKALPPGQVENFASKFKIGTDKIIIT